MRSGRNRTIFRRLLISNLLISILGLGATGIAISYLSKQYLYDATQQELMRKARKVNLAIQEFPSIDERAGALLVFLDQSFDTRIWIFDSSGKIIATSAKDEVSIGKSVSAGIVEKVLAGESVSNKLQFEGLSEPMLSVAVPWGKEDLLYGGIVLHSPVNGVAETVGRVRETILWVTLFSMLLSFGMVSYVSWSISRPLQQMTRVASEIGMGDYRKRIDVEAEEEIDELAKTIHTLAEKLERMDLERKRSEQVRDDLLANVSHELRTPLTAMQGFLEALQDGIIPEEGRQRYYDVMYQETLQMNRLVDDLFELLKLEQQEVAISRHPVELEPLFHRLALKFSQDAKEKGLSLSVRVQKGIPRAYADIDRLEQILSNLLKNAFKFTERGCVTLHAKEAGGSIVLVVSDTGVGISDSDQPRIWERFFKADRGRSRKNRGSGLGLSIVKQLVELHEGEIEVISELNRGTTFRIRIPAFREIRTLMNDRSGSNIVGENTG